MRPLLLVIAVVALCAGGAGASSEPPLSLEGCLTSGDYTAISACLRPTRLRVVPNSSMGRAPPHTRDDQRSP